MRDAVRHAAYPLMVRSAPQERVSNHVATVGAAPPFETRPAAAPQDEADNNGGPET